MTREKKELLKQLEAINENERFEASWSPCELPESFYEMYEEQRREIYERLNVLMHGRLNDYFQSCVI